MIGPVSSRLRMSLPLALALSWGLGLPSVLRAQAPPAQPELVKECPEPAGVGAYYQALGLKGDLTNPEVGLLALRLIGAECRLAQHAGNAPIQSLIQELEPVLRDAEGLRRGPAFFADPGWSRFFEGFLRNPMPKPGPTGAPSDHYFPGTAHEVVVADPQGPTGAEQAFLTRWQALQGVLCALTNDEYKRLRANQQTFNQRLAFIREKGFLQYPWEVASNRGGDQVTYLVWLHPSLAFALGPVEGKTLHQLGEAARTSIQPTLSVALLGFMRYPLDQVDKKYTASYTNYWGVTLGIMTGPSTTNHPKWGPCVEFHYKAYSLGLSRHDTLAGTKETYLFTTFNLAKYLKIPQS